MASDCSFDVVSEVDLQEVDNAVNQTRKELSQRYDFKGSKAEITMENEEIKLLADNEFQLRSLVDILQSKAFKRGIALRAFDYGKIEPASGGLVRQVVKIQRGISKEKGRDVVNAVKELKLKIQAQIMDDQVRVSGKNKDDLQKVIQTLKGRDFGIELQFVNFRS
ncbi:MAG: YajQ family cyclic di-GMP-binding protein [Bacillota bacterium]